MKKIFSFRKGKHKIYQDCWYLYFDGKKTIFKIGYLIDYGYYQGNAVFKSGEEANGSDLQEIKHVLLEAVLDNYDESQYWVEEPLPMIVMTIPFAG